VSGAPPPVNTERTTMSPPTMKSHHERRLIRGNATSLAPMSRGRKNSPAWWDGGNDEEKYLDYAVDGKE